VEGVGDFLRVRLHLGRGAADALVALGTGRNKGAGALDERSFG